ncbi:glutathione peroxidase [Flavobacterium nackdongense]|uniref:Glutathione peroxidase n=1 Tax=Flavobacterium nackdongense TaxID=2547394 RepID=A0A4P6YCF8_9FLAO|nr:glutathione peroxidase [Flavobacterium nackdongense]QBN17993.1 glutathione peroxidase [Flavobacterium nackdongense]
MKNLFIVALGLFFFTSCQGQNKPITPNKPEVAMEKQTIYQFKVKDLSGKPFDFASLKGKKIMIVNTASKCGLTPQYKELEALYKEYSAKGFVIVGFPANNFAGQEPGTNEEIATFCQLNYGVTFPMMDKVSVKGSDMCAVYQFLTQKSKNGLEDSEVGWNFQKYLLNEKGELVKVISPRTVPTDPEIVNWVKG